MLRLSIAWLVSLFSLLPIATAAAAPSLNVQIAAPPMEGTVSIGVFNARGECIRVLHRHTPQSDIPSALNGFSITWDGSTDAGTTAPRGDYEFRGITVGEITVEGVAWHFNDWIDLDGIPSKTFRIELLPGNEFEVVQDFDGQPKRVRYTEKGERQSSEINDALPAATNKTLQASRGSTTISSNGANVFTGPAESLTKIELPDLGKISALTIGAEGAFWIIASDESGQQLRHFSVEGQFLRELEPDPGEEFLEVAASENDERIALISRIPEGERVRILARTPDASEGISLWKTILEKKIQPCAQFGIDSKTSLPISQGELPKEKSVAVQLIENALFPGKKNQLLLTIASFANGLWLTTSDGLPISPIAENISSPRSILIRNHEDEISAFTLLGNAVAEYSLTGLSHMMQFSSEKIIWPPGPRETADEENVPSKERAPDDE